MVEILTPSIWVTVAIQAIVGFVRCDRGETIAQSIAILSASFSTFTSAIAAIAVSKDAEAIRDNN